MILFDGDHEIIDISYFDEIVNSGYYFLSKTLRTIRNPNGSMVATSDFQSEDPSSILGWDVFAFEKMVF